MGTESKLCSVILRFCELSSAAIVAGIVGRYLFLLTDADAHAGSRIVYAEVMAGISMLLSILLFPPLKYSFYCFPVDFTIFICWMVAFGLLCGLTGTHACDSYWYWNSWGYYWGRYWYTAPGIIVTPSLVGTSACGEWRATLAFSFIGGWCWFVSGLLGIIVITQYSDNERSTDGEMGTVSTSSKISHWRPHRWRKSNQGAAAISTKEESTNFPAGNPT